MIPGSFNYHKPADVDSAVNLLIELGEDAHVLAGGHSLVPMMKLRMASPEHLIDLQFIPDLKGISIEGTNVKIGAMTTQAEIISSEQLESACPILRETSKLIADPQVRNFGTIGGNVANGDPGNDMPAVMLALNAAFHLVGKEGTRTVSAREFYQAAFFTARDEGEILTSIEFKAPPGGHGYAYCKQKRKIGDYATAAAAAIVVMSGGKCSEASIALTNVGDTPLFAEEASNSLIETTLDEAAASNASLKAEALTNPVHDGRGPVDFKRKIAAVMVRRAIETARNRAQ